MSVEDQTSFARLEMQVADLKADVSKISDTVSVLPSLVQDVDALKRQTAQIFEQQMEHAKILLKHAELHTAHSEGLMAQREETRKARQSASDLSAEFKDSVGAMTRFVDASQRSTAGEIASLTGHVEALAKGQSLVATETHGQTLALASLNKLIVTLTDAVTKNVKFVKLGLFAGAAVGAAIVGVYLALKGGHP